LKSRGVWKKATKVLKECTASITHEFVKQIRNNKLLWRLLLAAYSIAPDDGGSIFLRYVGDLSDYTVPHFTR
jgi:hypothetical protein